MVKVNETVLVIPDIQYPFHHKDAHDFLEAVAYAYEPTQVLQIGDLVDNHAISDYVSDPDGYSPGHELKKARKNLNELSEIFPEMKIVLGNHDERIYRKAYMAGLPKDCIKSFSEIMELPEGYEVGDEFEIDGVIYEHGDKLGNGNGNNAYKKAIDANMCSTVFGHFHAAAGIRWFANKKHLCFAFNVGCLMDVHSYAAAYGKKFINKPILGCGIVDRGLPTFVPMLLNSKGRWVGEI